MTNSQTTEKQVEIVRSLVDEGYKIDLLYDILPIVISPEGKKKYAFWESPAGFSWRGFLLPMLLCCRIKEYSFFWILGICNYFIFLLSSIFGSGEPTVTLGILILVYYGFLYPYLVYSSDSRQVEKNPWLKSTLLAIIFTTLALLPLRFGFI